MNGWKISVCSEQSLRAPFDDMIIRSITQYARTFDKRDIEVNDVRIFELSRQIQKLAGLS